MATTMPATNTTRFNVSSCIMFCDKENLRACVEFWAIEITWFIYCCVGIWAIDRPLRIISLILGVTKIAIENVYRQRGRLTLSLFMTYLLGRTGTDNIVPGFVRAVAVTIWAGLDFTSLFYKPFVWATTAYEGLLAIVLLAYLIHMIMALQERGRGRWLLRLSAVVLWGVGWGITIVLHYWQPGMSKVVVIWLMLYEALFPRKQGKNPGSAGMTPPVLKHPCFSALARRRMERRARVV